MSLTLTYVPMTSATKPSSITPLSWMSNHTKERRLGHEYQNVAIENMAVPKKRGNLEMSPKATLSSMTGMVLNT
ncbi:Cytotoxin 4N [Frankliniella fusca]|uniref:Cytotoxin 4N n=1 Tax=Frankliniella fusca TaxID=407009 RepID=A0AAE1HL54_9NEOP|nr:Cytotoxin 4N [Frankliniella fusca]